MLRVDWPAVVSRFLAVLMLFFPALAAGQKKDDLPHPKTLAELQQAMKEVLDKEHVPGAGVALVANGELLWCGGIGNADIAANRAVICDTEFRVGGISKTFVALALLKLQEEGKINLKHFEEPQTVRWPPGTRMSFSNPGNAVAGYLIEKVTGKPYDQYVRETFLRPMGMDRADYPFTEAARTMLATAYEGNPPKVSGYPFIYLRPAGDLKASPGELAKLVQFLLRRGKAGDAQLVTVESILRMEAPETTLAAKNGLRLGYGLCNDSSVQGGVVTHGHDGAIDGFISSYRYVPEKNWGYVILLNSDNSRHALENLNHLVIDFLSKDFVKAQQPAIFLDHYQLERFAGYYASRAPRSQLFAFVDDLAGGTRIRMIDGKLTRSGLFGQPEPLLPVGANLFRGEKEPEGTTVFFVAETGNRAVVSSGLQGISYSERSSLALAFLRIALLSLCLFFMLTSLPYALVWLFLKLIGGMKDIRHLAVRTVPLLATLSLLIVPLCLMQLSGLQIGSFNLWTAGIFLGTLFFPVLSVIGLFLVFRVPKQEIHRAVRIHSLLVSSACCVITGFLWSWHLLGLRLWAP